MTHKGFFPMTPRSYHSAGLLLALLLTATGCSGSAGGSASDGRRHDKIAAPDGTDTPAQRAEKISRLGNEATIEDAPTLIDALEDNSPEVRAAAVKAAEKVLGAGIAYRAFDPPDERRAAVDRYRRLFALAQENGVSHIIDTVPLLMDQLEDEDVSVRRQAYEDIKQLTGAGFRFVADGPADERQQVVERYRHLWQLWNQPGNEILERLRDPDKMREYKRERVEEIKRRRAEAGQ